MRTAMTTLTALLMLAAAVGAQDVQMTDYSVPVSTTQR